jgi:transketolase
VNTLRVLGAELPNLANSGHPGAPIAMSPLMHVLLARHATLTPSDPTCLARDRFVLSNGHACALLYSSLHLTGFPGFGLSDLRAFRQLHSATPGHPEAWHNGHSTPGIEVTTGPLGQGLAQAVGIAAAARHVAASVPQEWEGRELLEAGRVFVTVGDGCLQEGVASEAASLAGHLGLGSLVVLYDDNQITIDGPTSLSFTESVPERFASYGWQVLHVEKGDSDLEELSSAIATASAETSKPTIICVRTTIGLGTPKEGTEKVHGSPIGADALIAMKKSFGFPEAEPLTPTKDVYARYTETLGARGAERVAAWNAAMTSLEKLDAAKAAQLRGSSLTASTAWATALQAALVGAKSDATRKLGGAALEALKKALPGVLFGGSADLTPSNNTMSSTDSNFAADTPAGSYIRFGVREHAMAAMVNGITAYQPGVLVPYCATFLNFIQYNIAAIRLGALSHFRSLHVYTHDSIGLGEDGPTHQPVNAAAMVRSMPHAHFWRPASPVEVAAAFQHALQAHDGPTIVALTRQGVADVASGAVDDALKGAYVVTEVGAGKKVDLVLVATGSEVGLAQDTAAALTSGADALGLVRVVSMPCADVFDQQTLAYRSTVLGGGAPILSVEAMSTVGWARYAHAHVGLDRYGLSAPAAQVFEELGFSVANVSSVARKLIAATKGSSLIVPSLLDM